MIVKMKPVIPLVTLFSIALCFNDYDYHLYENFDLTKKIFENEQVKTVNDNFVHNLQIYSVNTESANEFCQNF